MREPDQSGDAAKAWIVPPEQFPPAPAHLASWMVHGVGFHAAWNTWIIQACHLRPIAGLPAANLHYPEAEFEIMIIALNPEIERIDPDEMPKPLPFLQPFDLVKQFHGCTDQQAVQLVGLMVREICAGRMSPDQDYRQVWGRVIDQTVAHYRAGGHDPD